ncbi:hypothetical protein IIZ72_01365 [Candidatus Saccharibacteria bacterium]|nr:hypothetical protein [Candidatus Saccharibacteria bacterium]
MERDSFPAGEQDSGQGSGEENAPEFPSFEEHMEHMKQPEGKVNDGRVEKDSNGEDLEKTRNKFVNAYTLAAINKTLDIYKIVNDAERRYKEEAVEEKSIEAVEKFWDRHVFGDGSGGDTISGSYQGGSGIEFHGHTLIDSRIATYAYRAGAALFAGSEEGMKKTTHLDLEYDKRVATVEVSHPNWSKPDEEYINTEDLDPKQVRLIRLGAKAMRKALPEAVRKRVQLIRPEV